MVSMRTNCGELSENVSIRRNMLRSCDRNTARSSGIVFPVQKDCVETSTTPANLGVVKSDSVVDEPESCILICLLNKTDNNYNQFETNVRHPKCILMFRVLQSTLLMMLLLYCVMNIINDHTYTV